jgi:hypothetical protein
MQFLFVSHVTRRLAQVVCLSVLSALCGAHAFADTTFSGEDLNAGPGGPFPASDAAAASFTTAASAIGTVGTITFESAPLGAFTSLTVAPGVTASGPAGLSILNSPSFPPAPSLDGFNTTPGGSQYIEDQAGTITFTFAKPTQFFGAYLTGLQNFYAQDLITFSDGTTQVINAPETGTGSGTGATDFVGFTDPGKLISSITITSMAGGSYDYIGIDDVKYQVASAVPEPASIGVLLTGLVGLFLIFRAKSGVRRLGIVRTWDTELL